MKTLILLINLFFSYHANADEISSCHNSISKHLSEAIKHNFLFSKHYSKLSGGNTLPLSLKLISGELLSHVLTKSYDIKARKYQNHGIPLLCDDLISMNLAPSKYEKTQMKDRPIIQKTLDIENISQNLKYLLRDKKLNEVYALLESILNSIEDQPQQLCLTRHFLESMARSIFLLPTAIQKSLEQGLEDPTELIIGYLKLQRSSLHIDYKADTQAFKFQKEGIPIFCNDVPFIPWK